MFIMANNNNQTLQKFRLVSFSPNNPTLWFLTAETLFRTYHVDNEATKFAHLLQCLENDQAEKIQDIIVQHNELDDEDQPRLQTPYTAAKTRLLKEYDQSQERKLDKMLQGAGIPEGTKPTVVLQKLRSLAGNTNCDDIIKRVWLSKLNHRIREILSLSENQPISDLAEKADKIWELQQPLHVHAIHQAPAAAPVTTVDPSLNDSILREVLQSLKHLNVQVEAIQAEQKQLKTYHQSRPRYRSNEPDSRSPTPSYHGNRSKSRLNNNRTRSRTGSPYSKPTLYAGVCWYHYVFGSNARKCADGCRLQDTKDSSPENSQ